ncbi:MAG: ParB/RepB/Spo0J family partition protein [Intrasporangium sp.]|uniref:ParB/RepB/Spo0J family partition protein n=1 Tax=Intrasporangium sp. TaxID=1925024 RepID=UPI002648A659|nr:ParB/RepB/Spo0J family partition protein [Intrasporangium sp.]MDN5797698.1 ParB/RepB/Spo0J family partition protein [Intrasporangium sp.]
MADKRQALGRGLGALIPSAPPNREGRPVDVFFPTRDGAGTTSTVVHEAVGSSGDDLKHNGAVVDGEEPTYAWTTDVTGPSPSATDHGLPTLDRTALAPVPGAEFAEVPVDAIRPNPRQPRTIFDEDELSELVHSITEVGILQPVVVRRVTPDLVGLDGPADADVDDAIRYELVMGERRWRAAKAAGLEVVPAIVKETKDDDLLRDALLENLHRSQLNPLEEAAAYQQLLDDFGCTQDQLATRIGRSRPQVSNTLRLLRLPPLVQRRVAAGVLSAGHARALLGLSEGAAMERLAQRIVAEGLSVRTVEEIVTLGDAESPQPTSHRPRSGTRHPQLDDYTASLADRLDTRVGIALGRRKGKITVEFASVEDLRRILTLMGVARMGVEGPDLGSPGVEGPGVEGLG